jgi:hypothetical protein
MVDSPEYNINRCHQCEYSRLVSDPRNGDLVNLCKSDESACKYGYWVVMRPLGRDMQLIVVAFDKASGYR